MIAHQIFPMGESRGLARRLAYNVMAEYAPLVAVAYARRKRGLFGGLLPGS